MGTLNSFEVWQWYRGKSNDICHNCGGMTNYHPNGRFGAYLNVWGVVEILQIDKKLTNLSLILNQF